MLQVTREIWKTVGENAQEKARYLRNVFWEYVQDFRSIYYLDIGVGLGYNTLTFGQDAREILAIDIRFRKNSILRDGKKAHLIVADARFFPLKKDLFDMVSLFSVIEHVTDQRLVLKEALHVLKSKGKLIIQIPNRFFPLEPHSGLPFVFLTPSKIRRFILGKIG